HDTPPPCPYTTLFRSVRGVGRQERGCCRRPRRAGLVRVDGAQRGRSAPPAARAAAARPPHARRVLVRLAVAAAAAVRPGAACAGDRKSTRLNSSHVKI